jgi:hypothetical protein
MVRMKQLGLILTVCPEEICTAEIVFAFGQTWLVLIFPREYTTYVLLSKRKIFSCAPMMENLQLDAPGVGEVQGSKARFGEICEEHR